MSEVEYDSEVMSLIADLELVPIGSPEYREFLARRAVLSECTFDRQFELDRQNRLSYIMRGLNPRYHQFRKNQSLLFSQRQLSLDL